MEADWDSSLVEALSAVVGSCAESGVWCCVVIMERRGRRSEVGSSE